MGLLDSFMSAALLQKAGQAVQAAEMKRKLEARKVALEMVRAVAAGAQPEAVVEARLRDLLAVTSQGQAVRGIAAAVGNPMAADVLGRVADKLEGK